MIKELIFAAILSAVVVAGFGYIGCRVITGMIEDGTIQVRVVK